MLSAMNSASYKSSLLPEGAPREEPEIREEIHQVEKQINDLLDDFSKRYCIVDPYVLDVEGMFITMDRLKLIIPALCDDLDNLEEELGNARYEPEQPEDL